MCIKRSQVFGGHIFMGTGQCYYAAWDLERIGDNHTWWALEPQSDLLMLWPEQVEQKPQKVFQGSPPHQRGHWKLLHPWGSSS